MTDVTMLPNPSAPSINPDFRTVLKQKVIETFLGLIPEQDLEKMIEAEVKEFFENKENQIFKVGNVVMKKKDAEAAGAIFRERDSWPRTDNPDVDAKVLQSVCPMGPFRLLVWSTLRDHLKVKFINILTDVNKGLGKELDNWLLTEATEGLKDSHSLNFNALSMKMSNFALHNTMKAAATSAVHTVAMCMPANEEKNKLLSNAPLDASIFFKPEGNP